MEILIITENSETETLLLHFVDKIIAEEKLHNLDIISKDSDLFFHKDARCSDKGVFILIDARIHVDIWNRFNLLRQNCPYCELGIISDTYQQAVSIVNKIGKIQGCIAMEEKELISQLRLLLCRLDKKEQIVDRAMIWNVKGVSKIIPYEEIDFIDTVKGKHYCIVNYGKKQTKIRSSIRNLNMILDERFVQVKSSVIVNITKIDALDRKKNKILFRNGVSCYFSDGYKKNLLDRIKMQADTK